MELFEDALERVRRRYFFAVAGYVVMPEHVHLLVRAGGPVIRLDQSESCAPFIARFAMSGR